VRPFPQGNPPPCALARPEKELKAFAKVRLAPGETQTLTSTLDEAALAYYDPGRPGWVAGPGTFTVLVGSSARHIHLTGQFEWQGGAAEAQVWYDRAGRPPTASHQTPAADGGASHKAHT